MNFVVGRGRGDDQDKPPGDYFVIRFGRPAGNSYDIGRWDGSFAIVSLGIVMREDITKSH